MIESLLTHYVQILEKASTKSTISIVKSNLTLMKECIPNNKITNDHCVQMAKSKEAIFMSIERS